MVRLDLTAVLLAGGAALARAVTGDAPPVVPGAYIVEYEQDQDSHAFVESLNGQASLRKDLRFKLFQGVSLQFNDIKNAKQMAAKLRGLPSVKSVYPVRRYSLPPYTVHSTGNAAAAMIAKREDGGRDTFSPHLMTQINKFRNAGITGKGVKIAIIDSGTDYRLAALGGCFGPGCLVSYGADLVGNDYNGHNTPHPGPDPLDTCEGHGTHVAGIIAARSDNPYGIIGAAQGVTLGSYRVFGCNGKVGTDILIAAYNMAYEAGSDIITASIGKSSGWSEEPWAVVVSRIVENGVPCILSAGNDGSNGIFDASSAACAKKSTAVASVDNARSPALMVDGAFSVNGRKAQTFSFTFGTPAAWSNVSLPLWAVSYNTTDPANGCDPYPESTPDLSGYIVLVRRGTCTFVKKVNNAAAKGAKYVMLYNNVAGATHVSTKPSNISAIGMVTPDQGASWIHALEGGSKVVLSMPNLSTAPVHLKYFNNTASAGFVSDYTSWGPTFELDVKPQFGAPGGNILSTYLRDEGGYAVLSGTSMATPLVAAVYALLINVLGTRDPKTLEDRLSSTAHPNIFRQDGKSLPFLAPVPQQGAGLIQAWDAAHATTTFSVSSLSFNDTDHFNPVQNFSISNTGGTSVVYSLSNVGAGTAYTFPNDTAITPSPFPGELTGHFATLDFVPSTFTLPAGHRMMVQVTAAEPKGVDRKRLPVYSGYIAVNGSDGSAFSLPYLGVAGSMRSTVVLDATSTWLSLLGDTDTRNVPVKADHSFLLPPPGHSNETRYLNNSATQFPNLVVTLAMGSALVRADVVPLSNCSSAARNASLVLGMRTMGQPDGWPLTYAPRGPLSFGWDGSMFDGSYAPAGRYQLVVRALRIFGDPNLASDYDATQTVPFSIRYMSGPTRRSLVKEGDHGAECDGKM